MVLPTVEQGLVGLALWWHLVGARHDEERDKRVELPGEVVVRILDPCFLVCDDQYLANDMFQREGGRLLMITRHRVFSRGLARRLRVAIILLTPRMVKPL